MNKNREVDFYLRKIWSIVHTARECLEFSLYLFRPNSEKEAEYINKSQHLQFIRHVLWRNCAIELSKLLSKSRSRDKFNIYSLLQKFEKNNHFGHYQVEKSVLKSWDKNLDNHQETIHKILFLRDKVYGHTDNISLDEDLVPTFENTQKLILSIEEIIQEISSETINVYFDMSNVVFDRERFFLVKNLAEYEKYRIAEINQKYGQNK